MTEDSRLHAIIADSQRNERTNEAVAADVQYKPAEWTPAQERELIDRIHGPESERLDRLIAEANERNRHA